MSTLDRVVGAVGPLLADMDGQLAAAIEQAAQATGDLAGATALVQALRARLAAVHGPWTPAQLADLDRPEGPGYVRYEDTYRSSDRLLTDTINRVPAGLKLTLPPGLTIDFPDFSQAYRKGLSIGRTGYQGCTGVIGSGRSTVLRPSSKIQTSNPTRSADAAPLGTSIELYKVPGFELANLALAGKDTDEWDGDFFDGLVIDSSPGARIHHLYLSGANPGAGNSPPRERFGINPYRSDGVVISDVEIDGRHARSGEPVCTSGIGWNGSGRYPTIAFARNATIRRSWIHDGHAGMVTFWETSGIYTEDLWTYNQASGSGDLSGAAVNHEQCTGPIVHVRPVLLLNKTCCTLAPPAPIVPTARNTNSSGHLAFNTAAVPGGVSIAEPRIVIVEPTWDTAWKPKTGAEPGVLTVEVRDGYTGGITGTQQIIKSTPLVIKGGRALSMVDHLATPGWTDVDPTTTLVRIR